MKKVILMKEIPKNKISFWLLAFFLMTLPFDRFYSEIILLSLGIHLLIHLNKEQLSLLRDKKLIILQSVFWVGIVSMIYSADKAQAIDDTTRQLAIFIFPLLFCLCSISISKNRSHLLFLFSVACTVTTLYLFIDAIHTIQYYKLPLSALSSSLFGNHNFSQPIDIHATYFSMYLTISLVFMLQQLIEKKENKHKVLYGISTVILSAGLIQLSSKSVFFAILIILNIIFPLISFRGKGLWKFMLTSSIFCICIIVFLLKVGDFKERYFLNAKADLSNTKSIETAVEPRMERWKAAWKIIKQSPLVGHGSGTETNALKQEFFSQKMYVSYLKELNAHNEYLSLMIKSGSIGFLIYIFTIFFGIRIAIKKKDIVFLSFMVLIATVSISENILDVNKGIFFYSFFFSLFIYSDTPVPDPAEKRA